MTLELLRSIGGDKRRHHNQASVALAEPRALPDVAVYDLLGKLNHLGNDGANTLAGWIRLLGHRDLLWCR
jgi:hypothetical protein